jgi:putative Mn2+ efflux pump MntP
MPHNFGTALKLATLVLSLGLDTFTVAVALGISGLGGRSRVRAGLSFALFEGCMPLIGFLIGGAVSGVSGDAAAIAGLVVLFGVGAWMVYEGVTEGDEAGLAIDSWRGLLLTSLSVSLDELAIGFSMGALGLPIALTIALIAVQAFVVTIVGTAVGKQIGDVVAERAEVVAGLVLCGLALVLVGEKVLGAG